MAEQPVAWASLQLGSEEELQYRLSFIDEKDAIRGVFIKGVLEVVRQIGDEAAVERCLEVLGEKELVDFFNYSMRTFLEMTYAAAHLLSDRYGGFEGAMWKMGHQALKNFHTTPVGRSMLTLAGGRPKGLLETMASATHSLTVGGESKARVTGPTSGVYGVMRDFMPPPYTEGALQAQFEATNAKQVEVHARRTGPFDTEYEIRWE